MVIYTVFECALCGNMFTEPFSHPVENISLKEAAGVTSIKQHVTVFHECSEGTIGLAKAVGVSSIEIGSYEDVRRMVYGD